MQTCYLPPELVLHKNKFYIWRSPYYTKENNILFDRSEQEGSEGRFRLEKFS